MSLPVVAADGSPYRESPAARAARTRVHYRPGASLWSLLFIVLLTLPLAYAIRRQLPGAQRNVTCGTLGAGTEHRCTAWDRGSGYVRRVPCGAAQEAFDNEVAEGGLFTSPTIMAVSMVSPVESRPIPATGNFIAGHRTAMFSNVPKSSASDADVAAQWDAIPRPADGTMTVSDARALLAVCANAPQAQAESRSLALMIVPRDDRAAALVLLVGLVLLGLTFLRGSVVEVDPHASELRIADKLGPLSLRPVTVRLADVLDVVVSTGTSGPFVSQRVEIVLVDGSRIPLVASRSPFSTLAHQRAAIELKRGLGMLTS